MYGFRFFNLRVYQEAKVFRIKLLPLLNLLKESREYALYDQLNRSSSSILLNIAEGSVRRSRKEQYRYAEIAIGSLNESIACIDIASDMSLVSESDQDVITLNGSTLAKMLMSLMNYARRS